MTFSNSTGDTAAAGAPPPGLSQYWRPRFWPAWIFWGWLQLIARLPIRLVLGFHEALGRLAFRLPTRLRTTVTRNLELCFPTLGSNERDTLAKRHFAALGAAFAECALAWCASDRHLEGRFRVTGLEHVLNALEAGHGAILYTGHFTGLDVCGRPLKQAIPRFACMYSHRSNPLLDEIQRRGRIRCADESIPSDKVRALLGALKRNAAVWYAPDQAALGGSAALVPFFAEPAMMTTATSRIARLSGAPVLPFSYRRVEGGTGYVLEIHPPLENFPGDDEVEDTKRLAAILEQFVRVAPEQYFWTQKKFRGRPGMEDPYRRRRDERVS